MLRGFIFIVHKLPKESVILHVVFSTREHPFEQKRACWNDGCDEAVNQCRSVPVLAHAEHQQTDVGDEEPTVNGSEQRNHLRFATDVLQRHGIEHENEEGKTLQIPDKGHQWLQYNTPAINPNANPVAKIERMRRRCFRRNRSGCIVRVSWVTKSSLPISVQS